MLRGIAEDGESPPRRWVEMRPSRATALLGYEVGAGDAQKVFETLRMSSSSPEPDRLGVEVPGYRVDIEGEVDLIEEVARIQGYDRIEVHDAHRPPGRRAAGPVRVRAPAARDPAASRPARDTAPLVRLAGDLALMGDREEEAVRLANPLQADESFLRTRLTPGLLRAAARNRAGAVRSVPLFEVGTVFRMGDPVAERSAVAIVLHGPAAEGWHSDPRPFDALDATGVLEAVFEELRIETWSHGEPAGAPMHPGRSATVLVDGRPAGVVGELHPRVAADPGARRAGRPRRADVEARLASRRSRSCPVHLPDVPRFPPVRRDLAFVPRTRPRGRGPHRGSGGGGELLEDVLALFDCSG